MWCCYLSNANLLECAALLFTMSCYLKTNLMYVEAANLTFAAFFCFSNSTIIQSLFQENDDLLRIILLRITPRTPELKRSLQVYYLYFLWIRLNEVCGVYGFWISLGYYFHFIAMTKHFIWMSENLRLFRRMGILTPFSFWLTWGEYTVGAVYRLAHRCTFPNMTL